MLAFFSTFESKSKRRVCNTKTPRRPCSTLISNLFASTTTTTERGRREEEKKDFSTAHALLTVQVELNEPAIIIVQLKC